MICVLQHSGIYNIYDYTLTEISGLSIYLRVCEDRTAYNNPLKNGVRSIKLIIIKDIVSRLKDMHVEIF